MIKLPVQLTEHRTWEDAVGAAIAEQRRLEELSQESGDTIRPIVLYQAESNIQGAISQSGDLGETADVFAGRAGGGRGTPG